MLVAQIRSLVPMAYVRDVGDSIAFYRKLGFEVANTFVPRSAYPFYAPRGEFRVSDPGGYVLRITHT